MDISIERFKLSQTAKDQLIRLKKITRIEQWNILCRWAFCRSLAEPSIPSPVTIPADSNVELTWKVFGGEIADLLFIALKQRCYNDHLEINHDTLYHQFRLHLHRGISYLSGDEHLKSITDLIWLIFEDEKSPNTQET